MSKIGQQISNLRNTTPKHVQWILLGAALIVVLVLAFLLIGGKQKTEIVLPEGPEEVVLQPELLIEPRETVDWSKTFVGESQTQEVKIGVANDTKIKIIDIKINVDGSADNQVGISAVQACTGGEFIVNKDTSCTITVNYKPQRVVENTKATIDVKWVAIASETQNDIPDAVTFVIGAVEKPKPVVETPNVSADAPVEFLSTESDAETSSADDLKNDLDDIAPELVLDDDVDDFDVLPNPVPQPIVPQKNNARNNGGMKLASNPCSDFAFAGYGLNGVQNGWIRPRGGAYYFHPFADKNCETPTGIYDSNTGYVMDINNPTKKIGTDAEHIRFLANNRLPELSGVLPTRSENRTRQLNLDEITDELAKVTPSINEDGRPNSIVHVFKKERKKQDKVYLGTGKPLASTQPYDRTFLLRQYKPIPATIVSDIQADKDMLEKGLPVRATVDRNVYSDNGRTVIIPTGTLLLGRVTGQLPGPYKAVGKMQIEWYQFIRPDGVEFNFNGQNPFSGDAQGRRGVPGHGSTDYLQQFVMPMLTAVVPAAVNMIAPISDKFVNQIDLDNNTVVQSGTVRSSEMAKNEIITAWNNVATKLLVDMMDNTVPPFSIAAGTRITVFSPVDLLVTCYEDESGDNTRECAIKPTNTNEERTDITDPKLVESSDPEELIGQVRSMLAQGIFSNWCEPDDKTGASRAKSDTKSLNDMKTQGYSFATVDFYCRSLGTYKAINNAKQEAVFANQKDASNKNSIASTGGPGTKEYNTQVLGLKYDDNGAIQNPFQTQSTEKPAPAASAAPAQSASVITCEGGAMPDANGCCPGETLTDMGEDGLNCCPDAGGDCFPPITY